MSSSSFVDDILQKYNCHTATDNLFSNMSSQTLAGRIATLKGHVFTNTNSHSGSWDQTNYDEGSKIDLSNNTPPSRLSMLTNSDSNCNQSEFIVDLSKSNNTSIKGEDAERQNRVANSKEIIASGASSLSYSSLNLSPSGINRPGYEGDSELAITALTWSDKLNDNVVSLCSEYSERRSSNPVVVITPAMAEEGLEDCVEIRNMNTNGELSAAMLKDTHDTCSLSSVGSCSENEILTDDEPSDDEIKPPVEEKSEKVRAARWSIYLITAMISL